MEITPRLLRQQEVATMGVRFHPHARERMAQRGASEQEAIITVESGERFDAKFSRVGFRRNFVFRDRWRGKYYETKQVEAYAVREEDDWLVISVITRYF